MADEDELGRIEDLVNRFSDAEQSLRSLLMAAQQLTSARDELSGAREEMGLRQAEALDRLETARRSIRKELRAADLQAIDRLDATVAVVERRLGETEKTILARFDDAECSLESSQKALADTASGVYGLTSELKDIARDMKDAAIALRALNPKKMTAQLGRIQALLFVLLALAVAVGTVAAAH